jgi:hypothetical protein
MLAASKLGSNVTPNHLQAAPVMTSTSIAPNEFKKNLTASVFKTYPTQLLQQYATGQQAGRHPFIVVVQNRKFSARIDSNGLTSVEPQHQPSKLKPAKCTPGKTPKSPPNDINIKAQDDQQPSGNEQATGCQDNDSQPGIRCEAG